MTIERQADTFTRPHVKPQNLSSARNDMSNKWRHLFDRNILARQLKQHFIAMLGEFVGTFLFLFFAFSAIQVVSLLPRTGIGMETSNLLFISLSFGFSLTINAWTFFRITGSLFNPAVSLAMALVRVLSWTKACLVIVAQVLGGIIAAAAVSVLFPGRIAFQTTLAEGTSLTRGFLIEMFLTAELVFTICMLVAEKNKATFIAPVGIGLSLFVAELSGVHVTGGSLNPARSFGPCVVARSFPRYHWLYWAGPALGSVLGTGFYKVVKALEDLSISSGVDVNHDDIEKFNDEVVGRIEPALHLPNFRSSDDATTK